MKLSPIVLFVYNRPEHTRRTLEALAANDLSDQSTLYIYSDGPKVWVSEEESKLRVLEVRDVLRSKQWCKEVHIVESEYNQGLAASVVSGVSEVVNRHGRVIVLEDDIVTKNGFLRYMNNALDIYANDELVMHISGMIFGTPKHIKETTAFVNILSCNGWATWKRAWDHYTHDIDVLFERIREKKISIRKFNIEGNAHFYEQLIANKEGRLSSWAVRWYASWLTAGGYSLFPHRSLLINIGHDDTGTHSAASFYQGETVESIEVKRIPVKENSDLRREIDLTWRAGIRATRKEQRPKIKEIIRRSLVQLLFPARKAGRRMLRFFIPEMTYLDKDHPNFAFKPNVLRESVVAKTAKIYPPYHIREARIGDYSYISTGASLSRTSIGKFCSIGPNLTCGWGYHPINGVSTSPMFYSTRKQNGLSLCSFDKVQELKPIEIGNDVFIGMNVTVLDGVKIGDGAVIGAGAVVSKDIPPYSIAIGNPIRIIRYRFNEETIAKLKDIKWWEWPEEKLQSVEKFFFDVDGFVSQFINNSDQKQINNSI